MLLSFVKFQEKLINFDSMSKGSAVQPLLKIFEFRKVVLQDC